MEKNSNTDSRRFISNESKGGTDEPKSYDAFISYRREGGSETARSIKESLEKRGLKIFLDFDELKTGRFDKKLLEVISSCPNFLLILSPGSLDRCNDENDWLTQVYILIEKYTTFHLKSIPLISANLLLWDLLSNTKRDDEYGYKTRDHETLFSGG